MASAPFAPAARARVGGAGQIADANVTRMIQAIKLGCQTP